MHNQSQNELTDLKLTPQQQQRYDYLFPFYGKTAALIVVNLYGKGRNSWSRFLEKLDAVNEAKAHVKQYYDALYNTFQLNEVYTPGQVIGLVNEARREMGLVPHTEKIKLHSEYDFNLIFLVEDYFEIDVENGGNEKTFKGFRPIAKVKPE